MTCPPLCGRKAANLDKSKINNTPYAMPVTGKTTKNLYYLTTDRGRPTGKNRPSPGGEGEDGCTKLRRPHNEDAAEQNLFKKN